MKKVFIGHRGAGKTSLLSRHQTFYPDIPHFDLDSEIEKISGATISELFLQGGEAAFRKLELSVFNNLHSYNQSYVISLGAGFQLTFLPAEIEVCFVSRMTDADGRIFLNRPRLEPALSPLEEYKIRYLKRQPEFLKRATQIYHLPEGLTDVATEKKIFTGDYSVKDAYYTLGRQDLLTLPILVKQFSSIELRNDLFETEEIKMLIASFPAANWLVSIRKSSVDSFADFAQRDCDIRYYDGGTCAIVSSHDDFIEQAIQDLSNVNAHLKLCPFVADFGQLVRGFEWQQEDPLNRSFLPRSSDGKWLWYRQLAKYFQKINFVRNFTHIPDQPTLSEWFILPEKKPEGWGAVLGHPVHFSKSPQFHQAFFKSNFNSFFTRIDLNTEEFKTALPFLIRLGLTCAAVTSPLKALAFQLGHLPGELMSSNTLLIKDTILAANTDLAGFARLVSRIGSDKSVAVWGGGGTLQVIRQILPRATFYSSRTGRLHDGMRQREKYDFLIWAAPRTPETIFPPSSLHFTEVIDLNYAENSMGLEFAVLQKIGYTSGLEMFKAQALKQQEIWSQDERQQLRKYIQSYYVWRKSWRSIRCGD